MKDVAAINDADRKKQWCDNIVVESRNLGEAKPKEWVQRLTPVVRTTDIMSEVNDFNLPDHTEHLATQLRSMRSVNDDRTKNGEHHTSVPESMHTGEPAVLL